MANRRMLSKSISVNKQVNSLSNDFCRLLFTWIIPHLDDFGRISGDPEVLKALVMPMATITVKQIDEALSELSDSGLVQIYEAEGERILVYPKFDQHQQGLNKRTKSKFQDPPDFNPSNFQEIPGNSNPTEPNLKEEKEKEYSERKTIADENTFKGDFTVINPNSFQPSNELETAALEVWEELEPNNPLAFTTTYLRAVKQGLPAEKFRQFSSEIRHDPTVENKGKVFNKKLFEYNKEKVLK